MGYFYYSENLNWAAQNLRLGCMRPVARALDIAVLDHCNVSDLKTSLLFCHEIEHDRLAFITFGDVAFMPSLSRCMFCFDFLPSTQAFSFAKALRS